MAVCSMLQKYYYHVWVARRGDLHLQTYLKLFDDLLALLSKCLRLIQEAEVVSRGYTRCGCVICFVLYQYLRKRLKQH